MGHGKTNSFTTKDRGWSRLMQLGKQLAEAPFVKVGVLGRNDSRPGGDFGNVALAIVHEFGIEVPRRSFLRGTMTRMNAEWTKLLEQLARLLVAGKLDVPKALNLLGLRAANDVKATIQRSIGLAPNAPATIAAKGSSRPLVDTGRLLGSVDFDAVPGGKG